MTERTVLLLMSNIMLQQESLFSMAQNDSWSTGNRRGQRCRKCFTGVFVVLVAGEFLNVDELLFYLWFFLFSFTFSCKEQAIPTRCGRCCFVVSLYLVESRPFLQHTFPCLQ